MIIQKSATILKALLLGIEVNLPYYGIVKLFKPNDIWITENGEYEVENFFLALKGENVVSGKTEWLIIHGFSLEDFLDNVTEMSNEDAVKVSCDIALKLTSCQINR